MEILKLTTKQESIVEYRKKLESMFFNDQETYFKAMISFETGIKDIKQLDRIFELWLKGSTNLFSENLLRICEEIRGELA